MRDRDRFRPHSNPSATPEQFEAGRRSLAQGILQRIGNDGRLVHVEFRRYGELRRPEGAAWYVFVISTTPSLLPTLSQTSSLDRVCAPVRKVLVGTVEISSHTYACKGPSSPINE